MKFFTISLGPILFETIFKYFLEKNKDVLDYKILVDNVELRYKS